MVLWLPSVGSVSAHRAVGTNCGAPRISGWRAASPPCSVCRSSIGTPATAGSRSGTSAGRPASSSGPAGAGSGRWLTSAGRRRCCWASGSSPGRGDVDAIGRVRCPGRWSGQIRILELRHGTSPVFVVAVRPDVRVFLLASLQDDRADQLAGDGVSLRRRARGRRGWTSDRVDARAAGPPDGRRAQRGGGPRDRSDGGGPLPRRSVGRRWSPLRRAADGRAAVADAAVRPDLPAPRLAGAGRRRRSKSPPALRAHGGERLIVRPAVGPCPANWPSTAPAIRTSTPSASLFGDRSSQYDLWRPNPVSDPDGFPQQTSSWSAVCRRSQRYFDAVGSERIVIYSEAGRVDPALASMVGHGFRGFGPTDRLRLPLINFRFAAGRNRHWLRPRRIRWLCDF